MNVRSRAAPGYGPEGGYVTDGLRVPDPDKLAVQGASNGGLLTAISSMQRPDLWTAAVSRVGWVDLPGSARFPYLDRCSQAEIGDLTVADDVRRVMEYSPYHCVAASAYGGNQ